MTNRTTELEALARDVAARFHRLPQCPRGLTAEVVAPSNIAIMLHGRSFTVNALVVDAAMADEDWCRHVLKVVFGVAGRHVAEIMHRAAVSAALQRREVEMLKAVKCSAGVRTSHLSGSLAPIANKLVDKGLLGIRIGRETEYVVTDAGLDAIAAHA